MDFGLTSGIPQPVPLSNRPQKNIPSVPQRNSDSTPIHTFGIEITVAFHPE